MILRGKLVAFAAGTFLASVRLDGSGAQVLADIPTNRAIASGDMTLGSVVLVWLDTERNPSTSQLISIVF